MANPDVIIDSPCIRQCCLNENDICLGCFRTMTEICAWSEAKTSQRLAIIKNAEQRQLDHLRLYAGSSSSSNASNK